MKTRKTLNPERLYYLRDARQVVGNCLLWWGKGRSGYTCNLDNAHLFTESEAYSQHKSRASDIPYPKDLIDGLAYRHVDHQVTDRLEWTEENRDAPQDTKEAVENIAQHGKHATRKAAQHALPKTLSAIVFLYLLEVAQCRVSKVVL